MSSRRWIRHEMSGVLPPLLSLLSLLSGPKLDSAAPQLRGLGRPVRTTGSAFVEVKQQIVELAMAGRMPAELSRQFGVAAQRITAWVAQFAADRGKPVRGKGVESTAEREELARLQRHLQQERDILAKGYGLVRRQGRQDVHSVYKLVNANQADVKVRAMCRVLQFLQSGYSAWRDRAPSQRAFDNAVWTGCIRGLHSESDATYGMTPRARRADRP